MIETEPRKNPKNTAARRTSPVDLDRIREKLLNVLGRETKQLLDASYKKNLSPGNSKRLCNYLKLIKELQNQELEILKELGDEDLENVAKNPGNTSEKP